MLADSVPSEDPPPGLEMSSFSLCPHTGEKQEALVVSLLLLRAATFPWGSTPMTSSKPRHLPKTPSSNAIALGARNSTSELQAKGDASLQSNNC